MKDSELLRNFRQKHNLTQPALAKELGVSISLIASIETDARAITRSFNNKIYIRFKEDLLNPVPHSSDNIIPIPIHNISAAAGEGTHLDREPLQDAMYFDRRFLNKVLKVNNFEGLHLIYAQGDSMDSGWNNPDDIKDGDLLLVDENQLTGNNQVFVILVNNTELRVKRLYKRGDALYITSNNPKYKDEIYYPDDTDVEIKVIGKVVWNGSK